MKRIQKDYQTTPLTGVVEDSLQSNSTTNAPSINAVRNALTPPQNLLINGDFQIWQRRESISTSGTKTEYIADMWCSSYQSTFTKVANGLKTSSNAHILQLIPKLETGKRHSISISVNDVIYTDVFDGGTTKDTHEKYYYSTSRESAEKGGYSLIVIKLNAGDTLNWVDLFEGDVVYKHVKEDYAIALMRCQEFVKSGATYGHIEYEYPNNVFLYTCSFEKIFKKVPIVSMLSVGYTNDNGLWEDVKSSVSEIKPEISKFTMKVATPNLPNGVGMISVSYLATCEPA